jgi:RNA polymerase sigma factor (sigma-70 family)
MSDSGAGPNALTEEQQAEVEKALPIARKVALAMIRMCPTLEPEDIGAIVFAELAAHAPRWNEVLGASLAQYALKGMVGAVLDAAKKAESPRLRAARKAGLIHAEALRQDKDLARQIAETVEEKRRRARELGEDFAGAMYLAYIGKRPPPSVEDAVVAHETIGNVRAVRAALDPKDAAFLDLLYEEELGWEAIAGRLGISVSSAQRRERKLLKRLRAALLAKGIGEALLGGE